MSDPQAVTVADLRKVIDALPPRPPIPDDHEHEFVVTAIMGDWKYRECGCGSAMMVTDAQWADIRQDLAGQRETT